jgi:hypothetical protein
LGFRICRVSGFRILGSRLGGSDFGFRVSRVGFQGAGGRVRGSGFGGRDSGFGFGPFNIPRVARARH